MSSDLSLFYYYTINGIAVKTIHKPQVQGKDNLDKDVSVGLPQDDYRQINFTNKRNKPTLISQTQAKAMGKRMTSAKRRLPTDFNRASERDIQVLLKVLFHHIDSQSDKRDAALLVLLSLLIGTHFNQLRFCHFAVKETHCTLIHELKLQNYYARSNHHETYSIYLPHCFASILYDIDFSLEAGQESAKQLILQLNKTHQTKLNPNKISGFMYSHLLLCGVDRTTISLITHPNPRQQMSLHYVTTEQSSINAQFATYVDYLSTLGKDDTGLLAIPAVTDNAVVGSKASITQEELAELLSSVQKSVSFVKL